MINELRKIYKLLQEMNQRLNRLENEDKEINIVSGSRVMRVTRPTIKTGGR
ncbi:hypothetical protein [Clostridium estertheticum]|uniref:hypothetical protein n=1 Tax=Clostridium estertheticum TaxID=238834 RepID=UPI001CF16DA2|nr:hypothetical protein [Clostridium estertheticum]MCB2354355.1 hypothetical protein [Clostridium estertheticum]WAG42526.1 hypothetical protein LL065_07590 [Clostridium estertheticum]